MFHFDGVQPLMVIDGSKKQALGKLCKQLQEAVCEKKTTEPYSP